MKSGSRLRTWQPAWLRPPRTLQGQLLSYGAAVALLTALVATSLNIYFVETEARRQSEAQMLATATALATALQRAAPFQAQEALTAFQNATGARAGYQVTVIDRTGRVVAASDPERVGQFIADIETGLLPVLSGEVQVDFDEIHSTGAPVLDVSLPLYGDAANPTRITGALHLAVPDRTLTSLRRRLFAAYVLTAFLMTVLLIVPLWLYLKRRLLRPMQILMAADQAVAAGRAQGRLIPLEVMPPHELGDAMRSRNEMLARLEAAEGELRRRLRELSALNSTAALLSKSMALDEVLGRTLDKVLEITGKDAGEVSLYDPQKKRLVVRVQQGFSKEWLAEEADRPTTCLCGQVLHRQEPLCVADMEGNPGVTRVACVREGFRSFCAVPLQAEGRALGVMSLHGRQVDQASDQYRDLLAAIGNQVAISLQNIYLFEETRRLAITDALTGLANRRAFDARLADEMRRAHRYDRPLSLIMIDIDYFKSYNDTHGHPQGDALLRELAGLLSAEVRDTDFVARYGGEEFVVILPETEKAGASAVAEKIRVAVAAHPFPHRQSQPGGRLTVSMGVASFPEDLPESADLLQRADTALYAAKHSGRNRVHPWRRAP